MRTRRTLESARLEVQAFYDEHGKRPVVKEMPSLDGFMRRRSSTLGMLCDGAGLPKRKRRVIYNWTIEYATAQIQDFFDRKKYRPTQVDLTEIDSWLRHHHDLSVSMVADKLGLPGKPKRSVDGALEEIKAFHRTKGYRPTARDMQGLNAWLMTNHNLSISKLCNQLSIPGGRHLGRAIVSVRVDARAFFQKHGRRPTRNDMGNDDAWLKRRGSSLSKLCDKMSLPPARSRKLHDPKNRATR